MIRTFALAIMFALAACDQSASQVQADPPTLSVAVYQEDELGAQAIRMNACFPQHIAGDDVQFCNLLVVHRDGAVMRVSRIDHRTEWRGNTPHYHYRVYVEDYEAGMKVSYMDWHADRYHDRPIGQSIVGYVQYGDARYPELERHALSGTLIGT